ncbi:MAG: acyl--CoA ligase [Proteobacteria bacterium]|nr:acyl--CoA ligase [Pseudomonadota bacterium]
MKPLLTTHDPAQARRYYEEGIWRLDTYYNLLSGHASARPDAYALRDATRRLTYRQLLDLVNALALDLHRAGVRQGERVSIWLPNSVEPVIILLACSRNGYVCNPSLHQNYTVAEIVELLTRLNAAAVFAQPGYGADASTSDIFAQIAGLPFVRKTYRLEHDDASRRGGAPKAGFPRPSGALPEGALPPARDNPDKIAYLAFTSGTTGTPKGVMHSDNTLLANARAMVEDWGHDSNTVLLSLSPLSHHIATVAIGQAMVAGMELVVNDVPEGSTPLDWIIETGATYVMGVPTHAIDILDTMERRGVKKLGRVNIFYMAGSPIPRETARAFIGLGITPQNIYGMTENGSHQYTLPTDDDDTIVGTCGRACRGYEVTLWNPDNPDEPVAPGEGGEIGGRGGVLMLGYFDNQYATEDSFNADGWFMSGDLGRFDEKGCLYIIGRKKDLIIRGGHNIHPIRIESLAMRHPGVRKVAAFPVPDRRLGEKACLAVIPAEGRAVEAEEMLSHLHAEGLSKYDMPEHFIVMDSFPLTASGKVLKRELVEWAKAGKIEPTPVRWVDTAKRKEG